MIAVAVASLLVGTASAAPAVDVGGFDCDTCKLVIGEVQKYVVKEASGIEDDLTYICTLLPGNETQECKDLVQKDGSQIVAEIAKFLDPNSTCSALGLCTGKMAIPSFMKTADPNSTECTICKDLFSSIDEVLKNPQDQQEILKFIETPVCEPLGPAAGICDDLITTFGDQLLTYLAGKLDPATICADIDACTALFSQ